MRLLKNPKCLIKREFVFRSSAKEKWKREETLLAECENKNVTRSRDLAARALFVMKVARALIVIFLMLFMCVREWRRESVSREPRTEKSFACRQSKTREKKSMYGEWIVWPFELLNFYIRQRW